MRLLILLLLVPYMLYGQLENIPDVGSGIGVEKGTTIVVDSLVFKSGHTLLMQDNSVLIVNDKIIGAGIIQYGDVGDSKDKSQQVKLPQVGYDVDGKRIDYFDYRDSTDVNPKVIFKQCVKGITQIEFSEYVDVEYPEGCTTLNTTAYKYDLSFKKYQCEIYNTNGQLMYKGKYGDIFYRDIIDDKYTGRVLFIRFYIGQSTVVKQLLFQAR